MNSEENIPKTSDDCRKGYDRELLADLQHQIWSHWMRYVFDNCGTWDGGQFTITAESAQRWVRQAQQPYSDLTESEKDSDRHQADKIISLLSQQGRQVAEALLGAVEEATAVSNLDDDNVEWVPKERVIESLKSTAKSLGIDLK